MKNSSSRLFENPFLERLTHVHPAWPICIWGPVVVFSFWDSLFVRENSSFLFCVIAISGVLFWTLTEYILHRFLFHYSAKSKLGQRIIFLIHGIHHLEPQDATRLVMPPVPGLILGTFFYLMFKALIPADWVLTFFGGFIVGYLTYDYIHYAIHFMTPRTALGRAVRRHHYLHHYQMSEAKWGVSSPLWDIVFNTLHHPKDKIHDQERLAAEGQQK